MADSFADGWSGTSNGATSGNTGQVYDDYIPPSQGQSQLFLDSGQRSGSDAGSMFWTPAVSPDGTLASELLPESYDCFINNAGCENRQTRQNIPWFNIGALLRYPAPPLGLKMTNSGGSAVPAFSFAPNFLNHEAASYNVSRCAAGIISGKLEWNAYGIVIYQSQGIHVSNVQFDTSYIHSAYVLEDAASDVASQNPRSISFVGCRFLGGGNQTAGTGDFLGSGLVVDEKQTGNRVDVLLAGNTFREAGTAAF